MHATARPITSPQLSTIDFQTDPRHVEGIMRMNNGTLDSLSPEFFDHEVISAAECSKHLDPELAEYTAKSFGL